MRRPVLVIVAVCCALLLGAVAVLAQGPKPLGVSSALGTGFTYQGQLKQNGVPVNGTLNLTFRLYDVPSGGTALGTIPQTLPITGGLFTTLLDFGNQFNGDARWLGIAVGTNPELTPRQQLTAVPYAIRALNGWSLTGNAGTSANDFLGTTDGMSLTIGVSGTAALRLVPAYDFVYSAPNLIGGAAANSVAPGLTGATIGGGGIGPFPNVITGTGNWATIGGGYGNTASWNNTTIGGGNANTASGHAATIGGGNGNTASVDFSTVGGGGGNSASGTSSTVGGGGSNSASGTWSTVGGGAVNSASGDFSTVGGGESNTASGTESAILGGDHNTVTGTASMAGGHYALANGNGCFVWGDDSQNGVVDCGRDNAWVIRSTGGVYIYPGNNAFCSLTNATGWQCSSLSDRNAKQDWAAVDSQDVLKHVANLPIQTWTYKDEQPPVRHLGPVAQDFYAAFQVGADDKHINPIDSEGVALAAIQGLNQLVQQQHEEIVALKAQVASLPTRSASTDVGSTATSGPGPEWLAIGGLFVMNLCLGGAFAWSLRRGGAR